MKSEKQILKEKLKAKNEEERLKLIYKQKFKKSIKAKRYCLRPDKKKVSISKLLRILVLKQLKEVKNE